MDSCRHADQGSSFIHEMNPLGSQSQLQWQVHIFSEFSSGLNFGLDMSIDLMADLEFQQHSYTPLADEVDS